MQKIDLVAAKINARLHKAPALNETESLGKPSSESMIEHLPDASFSTYEAARARMPLRIASGDEHCEPMKSVWRPVIRY